MKKLESQKQFFKDLFSNSAFPGHGVRVNLAPGPEEINILTHGSIEDRAQLGRKKFLLDCEYAGPAGSIGDDRVPMLQAWSGTEVFAAAFGCKVHRPQDNAPFALPVVSDAGEADKLKEPDIYSGPLGEIFKLADRLVELCGTGYPVRICDIQSPFDIAALIWKKETFFLALVESPDAVHRLLKKVTKTMIGFIRAFRDRYKDVCLVHHPDLWMPPELGICLSEDDIGSISSRCFEEFCLPCLQQLSVEFGGISMHSCANSQHQWDGFLKLSGIRYLNLSHPPTDLGVSIEKFSGKAVLVPGGKEARECVSLAKPDTRFFFCFSAESVEKAREMTKEIKRLCKRQ